MQAVICRNGRFCSYLLPFFDNFPRPIIDFKQSKPNCRFIYQPFDRVQRFFFQNLQFNGHLNPQKRNFLLKCPRRS